MYENKRQRLAPKEVYYGRIRRSILLSALVLLASLAIGTIGYYIFIPKFGWYNSFLNASMILSGMGPMIDPTFTLSNSAKVFAAVYALFSGITFLTTFGLLIAPIVHRFFHSLHVGDSND